MKTRNVLTNCNDPFYDDWQKTDKKKSTICNDPFKTAKKHKEYTNKPQ